MQPNSNSHHYLWWIIVPMVRWPLSQLFQMTPALTWANTVPCNAQWDLRGMTLAVKCVSAASPRPSADLWPALRPAPMDMCKYTQWPHSPSLYTPICQASMAATATQLQYMRKLYSFVLYKHGVKDTNWWALIYAHSLTSERSDPCTLLLEYWLTRNLCTKRDYFSFTGPFPPPVSKWLIL